MKRCTGCRRMLPVREFSIDRSRRDGLRGLCKRCNRAVSKQQREKAKGVIPTYRVCAQYPKWLAP
mgnify:CR=1 FL=1